MANPALDVPEYPDVPDEDGVPPVLRDPDEGLPPDEEIVTEDEVEPTVSNDPFWGLYDQQGEKVLEPDSFLGVRYRDGSRIVDYPLEQGAFQSYNKVATPFDVAITMAIGSNIDQREGFLRQLARLKASLDLFIVITPEITFQNVNIEAYDYERRARNGASLIVFDIFLREVRTTAVAAFSPVKSDSAAEDQKQGQVQAQEPEPFVLGRYEDHGSA